MAWPKGKPRKAQAMTDGSETNETDGGEDAAASEAAVETLTYMPGKGDPDVCSWRRMTFPAGVPVEVTDAEMIKAARGNRYFHVGSGLPAKNPNRGPDDDMSYRAHVVEWLKDVTTVDQLVSKWASEETLRHQCEIGDVGIRYLGTLIDPKLRDMALMEGLNSVAVAEIFIKHGILMIPWRM